MYYYHYLIIIVTNIMLNLWQPYSSLNAKEYVIEYILFDFKVRETQRFYEVKNPVPSVIYCTCLLIFFFFDFRTQIIVWKSIGSITVVVCFRPSLSATQINMVDHFLCRVSFFNCTSSGLCSCNISRDETVFHQDVQITRGELKIWWNWRCLDRRWSTVSSVWCILSIETKSKE